MSRTSTVKKPAIRTGSPLVNFACTSGRAGSHVDVRDRAGVVPEANRPDARARSVIVSPLVGVAAQAAATGAEPALVGCRVSPGWSRGLTMPRHRDWPDVAVGAQGMTGIAAVVVVRRQRSHRVFACGYLVDTHCLGVKNTLGPRLMGDGELPGFVRTCFGAFAQAGPPLQALLELARHLVWGAVDASRRLGFHGTAGQAGGHG
jgi:hypothetical protein